MLDSVFEGGNRTHIFISKYNVAYCGENSKENVAFSKSILKSSLKGHIQTCDFILYNSLLRKKIDIPMGIDQAPFWANLFLDTYENEYMSELNSNARKANKVKARHFPPTNRFTDDLGTLNDGDVFSDVYKDIYPPKLQLKVEHSGNHATFLNLKYHCKR